MVDKIIKIPITDAFRYEDRDLTTWLCENIDVIGEAIDMDLANAQREQTTGNFYVDIKAEDSEGNTVVIENQFGNSDHGHLGKLLTYLTSFDAKVAVWIVENPRAEHIRVITWLNESDNGCDFYMLKLEAIKIGSSNPAPLLTKIIGPSEQSKQIGQIKKEHTQQEELRKEMWAMIIDKLQESSVKIFTSTPNGRYAYISATAGKRGLLYEIWVNQNNCRIELRIDLGKGFEEANLNVLHALKDHQTEIESKFGQPLNWAELDGYRACSVRLEVTTGGYMSDLEIKSQTSREVAILMKKLIDATKSYVSSINMPEYGL